MLFDKLAVLASVCVLATGCANLQPSDKVEAQAAATSGALPKRCLEAECSEGQAKAAIQLAKDQILAKLGKPEKSEFSNVLINTGPDGIAMVCGEVRADLPNQANFFNHFVTRANGQAVVLEIEVRDFSNTWGRFCVE